MLDPLHHRLVLLQKSISTPQRNDEISGFYPQFDLNTRYNPLAYNGDKNNKYSRLRPPAHCRLYFNIFVRG